MTKDRNADKANYYQSQIGILRWMVELVRVDIIMEIFMLSSFLTSPRECHLEAVFHIYAYLEKKHNSRMVFDPMYPEIDMTVFKECDWKDFYGNVKEVLPPNAPLPRGKEIDLRIYVDLDHASDHSNRRSRTGFFVFINMAPIIWYSKKQPTVETSVFGAKFFAMKKGIKNTRGLRYKLRMMGVPLDGPTYTYGDNISVIHNTQRPDSTLKKKSNSICYHVFRESVAVGNTITGHVPTLENLADLATKVIPGGIKSNSLIERILYDIA